ncbi:MAG: transposase [Actinomycetota bacterium]|nr:transposase [Actinomycetota bacterium]
MAVQNVPPLRGAAQVAALLDSPEIARLISDLQETRWTGRPGYAIRAMVGLALVKSVYTLPTWSRTVRLVAEHAALQDALGVAPSVHAAYRFTVKLREHGAALADCLDRVLAGLREAVPDLGANLAIDGSDLPAYANGMRDLPNGKPREHYADPDASWGHRSAISTRKGGGFYGYKVHAAVCTKTDLPIAWRVETASASEYEHMPSLLDTAIGCGFSPGTCVMDKGYDGSGIYATCESRDIRPVVPLKLTVNVANGKHEPPSCQHGVWTFAGSDTKRGASKWRCPTGRCQPASVWVKADRLHTLIPRSTDRWKAIYRTRVAVEREFGVLKHEWAMLPLRVRRLPRVRLHVDLTILARLACALTEARAVPLAA